ncbi:MAG: D-glycero-D-manno-heptose 1,7-bisphosphate phosphatase [Alteromonadaceae bacterium]|jgi:D-glycero-D-manno-heptose 1,7-bisphosphate phosphatase
MNKAVFLDRDGVINTDHAYVHKIEQFEFIDGVFDACRHFINKGYLLVVVTNQSGIGRGYYTEQDFAVLTDWMKQQFTNQNITINSVYFCPHHPKNALPEYLQQCDCRKPQPGMLQQAINDFDIDVSNSIMIGDKVSDMQAAKAAGVSRKVLVCSGQSLSSDDIASADEVWDTLADGVARV